MRKFTTSRLRKHIGGPGTLSGRTVKGEERGMSVGM